MSPRLLTILLIAFIASATGGTAQALPALKPYNMPASVDVAPPTRIGHVGGTINAIAVRDGLAYLGIGPRLVIQRVTDPAQPVLVGQSDVLEARVNGVAVASNYAYVIGDNNLAIFDVDDPEHPNQVGSLTSGSPSYYSKVVVQGTYAFLLSGARVDRVNITNPSAPVMAGSVTLPRGASDIAVQGQYVYVAVIEMGIRIIDGTTSPSPVIVGSYDPPGRVEDLAVQGQYAYLTNAIADTPYGVRILDISNPMNPRLVGSYDTPGNPYDIAVQGNFAYVADGDALRILDVSNPAKSVAAGSFATTTTNVNVEGGYAYEVEALNYAY